MIILLSNMNIIKNITIIISLYNEELNAFKLLKKIIDKYKFINIIIINDGSNDNTLEVIKKIKYKNLFIIDNNTNRGLTYSIIKGIKSCNTDYFIVMDWDFQHPITWIDKFVKKFIDWSDVVLWSRNNLRHNNFRWLLSLIWNFLAKIRLWVFKYKSIDLLTWFFWWKTIVFQNVINNNYKKFRKNWYKFLFEFLKYIDFSNVRIDNFFYKFWTRKYWKSKLWFKELSSFVLWLIK